MFSESIEFCLVLFLISLTGYIIVITLDKFIGIMLRVLMICGLLYIMGRYLFGNENIKDIKDEVIVDIKSIDINHKIIDIKERFDLLTLTLNDFYQNPFNNIYFYINSFYKPEEIKNVVKDDIKESLNNNHDTNDEKTTIYKIKEFFQNITGYIYK